MGEEQAELLRMWGVEPRFWSRREGGTVHVMGRRVVQGVQEQEVQEQEEQEVHEQEQQYLEVQEHEPRGEDGEEGVAIIWRHNKEQVVQEEEQEVQEEEQVVQEEVLGMDDNSGEVQEKVNEIHETREYHNQQLNMGLQEVKIHPDNEVEQEKVDDVLEVEEKMQEVSGVQEMQEGSEVQEMQEVKPKISGGRKMLCKICAISFQGQPYSDYQVTRRPGVEVVR